MWLSFKFFLGLLPVILILSVYYYFTHRQVKVDKKIWASIFGLGLLSALIALGVETLLISRVANFDGVLGSVLEAFLFVALIEELARFTFLWISYRFKKWFVKPIDFLTAGLLISLGFSALENVFYAYQYSWDTMLARIFTAVPAHACFGVIMGYFFYRYHKTPHWKYLVMGLLMPVVMHGLYDFFVIQNISESLLPGSLFILLMCILWSIYILRDLKKRRFKQTTEVGEIDIHTDMEEE